MVNLKMVLGIIATRCHPPAKLPLFLSYAQPFKINKKKNRILGKIKKKKITAGRVLKLLLMYLAVVADSFSLWCATGEKQAQDVPFPS